MSAVRAVRRGSIWRDVERDEEVKIQTARGMRWPMPDSDGRARLVLFTDLGEKWCQVLHEVDFRKAHVWVRGR